MNCNFISTSNSWRRVKHKARVPCCCSPLALVAIPSSGLVWCRGKMLLANLEKVEGATRRVVAGGPVALVAPEGRWPWDCLCPTRPWPAHRSSSCCYLKHWKDVNRMKSSDLLSSHVPSSSDTVSGDAVHLQTDIESLLTSCATL